MFKNCEKFNQPLNKWDFSNVREVKEMFLGCSNYNQK